MAKALMNDGQSLAWHMYPPFPWKGPTRRRTFAYMTTLGNRRPGVMIDEHGVTAQLDREGDLYDQIQTMCRSESRVIFSPSINVGHGRSSIVLRAALDKNAEVVYHPKGGVRGIKFLHKGSHARAGAFLVTSIWPGECEDIPRWIGTIRRTSDILGCGDYDTPGSLGQATLSRFWTERGLRRVWRLSEDLSDMLAMYAVGGRAQIIGSNKMVYPSAVEIDLSSAYPTAVARGIPAGEVVYHSRSCDWKDREAVFGLWRVVVHEDIEFSPIPVRDWNSAGGPIGWSLSQGWEFEYGGWEDEIKALVATGKASAEFVRGWSWLKLDSFLAPWVDSLRSFRVKAEDNGEPEIAALVKQVMNAAIGRWGMSNEQWQVIPDPMAKLEMGDLPMEFGQGSTDDDYGGELTGIWVRPVFNRARRTMPYHWSSYVKMAVRLELWRKSLEEMQRGSTIISLNFDSILMSERPQGSNDMEVAASQSEHPWNWKVAKVGRVTVPYNRAFIFEEKGGSITAKLPGISGDARSREITKFKKEAGA